MIQTANTMRLAFEKATRGTEKSNRTAAYAMIRSALNRKLGLTKRKTMWSVERARR